MDAISLYFKKIMKTVVIFGGSGFIGRHIIRRIAKKGYKIIVPYQQQINEAKLRLLGTTGQIFPLRFFSINEPIIVNQIENADVVLNLKTFWDEKKTSYQNSILNFNIRITKTLKKNNKNSQFIYFSGIGIDNDTGSNRSKAIFKSEKYIQQNLMNSVIIRPGVIIGGGDKFLKGLLPLFRVSYFIPLFGNGKSKFQPVFIDDVSLAIHKIIDETLLGNHIFEFVGPEVFTYKKLYIYISSCLGFKRVFVPIPFVILKMVIYILEKTPFSLLNREQLKLFENNNIASNNYEKLLDLDITPQDLREIIKKFVKKNS